MVDVSGKAGGRVENQPVRVICRYSNGIIQTALARAVSMDDNVLRVTTRESFEAGVPVTVMAPFLSRTTPGQVTSYKRTEEAGVFAMELKLRPTLAPLAQKTTDIDDASSELSGAKFRESCATLVKRLEKAGWIPYRDAAFLRSAVAERPGLLAATEVAVYSLLADRGLADMSELRRRIGSVQK
jgi:hypothetical protein